MRDKIEGTLFFLSKINMFCKLSEIHLLKQFRFVSLMFSSIWCLQERGRMERKEEEKLKKEKLICFVSPSTLYLTRPLQLTQALWLQSVLVVILMMILRVVMILRWSTEFRFDCSVDRISSSVGQIFESLKFLTRVMSWWWGWWWLCDDCSDDNSLIFIEILVSNDWIYLTILMSSNDMTFWLESLLIVMKWQD